ncbi:MAG: tetratricopeptide repeat protein [Anaerolineae bacterium]|nr:tetratricopeptide repeat protein [Anaerolineae bacterium]
MLPTSKLQESANPSTAIWDMKHVKAMLGLPRFPLRFIQEEPWRSWIDQRGGLATVRKSLLTACVSAAQQELLQVVLDNPGVPTQYYTDRLNISSSTFFRQTIELAHILISYLNSWVLEPSVPDSAWATNLPSLLTSLIGVEELLKTASSTLTQPDVRLLTVTGPGGVGKTHFAIQLASQVAETFRDGVFFVPLASVNDADLLLSEIVRVLGIEDCKNQSMLDIVKHYLYGRNLLLLLDSFEHLNSAAPLVAELLWRAPEMKIIVTSRERLHLSGEHCCEIPLLAVPDLQQLPPWEQLDHYHAVRLFVERARAVRTDFRLTSENAAVVAEICHRLDGLPLAIELAAARSESFPPEQIGSQIKEGLDFLKGELRDKDSRHWTLWNTIDWSYALLSEAEKTLFRRLAIFVDGCSLPAIRAVCAIDDPGIYIENLVNKSLVQFLGTDVAGMPRFQMLQTIHQYASRQLEVDEGRNEIQRRYVAYYLGMLEEGEKFPRSSPVKISLLVKQEYNNLRVVIDDVLSKDLEIALRLVAGILHFCNALSLLNDGRQWSNLVLSRTRHIKIPARVKVLQGAGWLAISQNDYVWGETCFQEALALAQELGDKYLIGIALQGVGEILRSKQEYKQARDAFDESLVLFREIGDTVQIAWTLTHLGRMTWHQADTFQARFLLEEAVALFQTVELRWGLSIALERLGRVMLDLGEYRQAQIYLEEALSILEEYGTRWHMAWVLSALGRVMLAQEKPNLACELLHRSLKLHCDVENEWGVIATLMEFANLFLARNDCEAAVQMSGAVYAQLGKFETALFSETIQVLKDMEVRILPVARSLLDETTYQRVWEQGTAMSLDEIMADLKQVYDEQDKVFQIS